MTVPVVDLPGLIPEIIMALGATLILLTEPTASRRGSNLPVSLSLLVVVLAGAAIWFGRSLTGDPATPGTGAVGLILDPFTQFFRVLVLVVIALVLLIAPDYARRFRVASGEFYALILFAGLGAMLMAAAGDLIVLFLGLEVHSIALYILAGSRREDPRSEESALKYLLLGAFASAFLLYGIALVYGATGTTELAVIGARLAGEGGQSGVVAGGPVMLLAGIAFLVVGLGFKIAAVPFHMWTPDVYEGAPTVITALMTVVPKAGAFAALIRIFMVALLPAASSWQPLWSGLAILTMTAGNILALRQEGMKRLLAYSSIAHAGYLLVGLVAGTELGSTGILYYLVAYALMNLGAFAVVVVFEREGRGIGIEDYAGLVGRRPLLGIALVLFMFSLAGVPPTAGFMGKLYLFRAAVESGHAALAVIAVLNSVLAAYYYLRVVVVIAMRPGDMAWSAEARVAPGLGLAILVAALGTLQLGLFPSFLYELARSSSAALG